MASKEEKKQKRIEQIMRQLKCTEAEAIDVYETDEIIDKGGRTKYDLPKEQEKLAMKIGRVQERKAKNQETNKRGKTRVENTTKSKLIAEITEFLTQNIELSCENIEILNKEKLISFKIGENTYELDLKQKRKPKK